MCIQNIQKEKLNRYLKFFIYIFCILFISCNYPDKKSDSQDDKVYEVTVSTEDLQEVKGWGITVDRLENSKAEKAELVDLGMTIGGISLYHNHCNPDGSVIVSAMDSSCDQIRKVTAHGLKYILCSWCPDYSVKDNHAMSGSGKLLENKEAIFESYWVNICKYIKAKGLQLPLAISVQNEPTLGESTYDGMGFKGQENYDYSQFSG